MLNTTKTKLCSLPKGAKYQKSGMRLEQIFYEGLHEIIKQKVELNYKPKTDDGKIIIEIDTLYCSHETKHIISFEIKGVNPMTIQSKDRQTQIINQGFRQKKYLQSAFPDYKIDVVYCFIFGKKKEIKQSLETETWEDVKKKSKLDSEFLRTIQKCGLRVLIADTPFKCAQSANNFINRSILYANSNNSFSNLK